MNSQRRIRVAMAVIILGLVVVAFAVDRSDGDQKDQSVRKPYSLVYESDRGRQLLGEVLREDFTTHLAEWDQEYDNFEPDPAALEVLATVTDPVRIVCVLGTWCSDSEREVPRFWKILDAAANPALELTMLAVGRSSDPEAGRLLAEMGYEQDIREQYGVELVPTFIFLSGDEELGRIIETPEISLEQDAASFLNDSTPGQPDSPAWK